MAFEFIVILFRLLLLQVFWLLSYETKNIKRIKNLKDFIHRHKIYFSVRQKISYHSLYYPILFVEHAISAFNLFFCILFS